MINVLFKACNKDCGVISVKRGAQYESAAPQMVEKSLVCGFCEQLLQRVGGDDKKQWRDRVPLPEPLPKFDWVYWNAI